MTADRLCLLIAIEKQQCRQRLILRPGCDAHLDCQIGQEGLEQVKARFASYGLTIHPDKTRIVDFRHPWQSNEPPQTFDFLGFTHYWDKTKRGGYVVGRKTKGAKFHAALVRIGAWCKEHRHEPMEQQHADLSRQVLGHYAYYGISGNSRALGRFWHEVKQRWHYWLKRRSRAAQEGQRLWRLMEERFRLPPA